VTTERALVLLYLAACIGIGVIALYWALSPPELLTRFYTAGIGLLSAGLFVPTIAGLWWKRANTIGGVAALVAGAGTYVLTLTGVLDVGLPPIVVALGSSALAMLAGGLIGKPETREMLDQIATLHDAEATVKR
jgi:sodium/pantothenate symporter